MLRSDGWSWVSARWDLAAPRRKASGNVYEGASAGSLRKETCPECMEHWLPLPPLQGETFLLPKTWGYFCTSLTTWFTCFWNCLVREFGKVWNCRLDKPQSTVRRACGRAQEALKSHYRKLCSCFLYIATENLEFRKGQDHSISTKRSCWSQLKRGTTWVCYKSQRLRNGDTKDSWTLCDSILSPTCQQRASWLCICPAIFWYFLATRLFPPSEIGVFILCRCVVEVWNLFFNIFFFFVFLTRAHIQETALSLRKAFRLWALFKQC